MSNPRQWVQPLFMVYDAGSDDRVPLTQERLDRLLLVERSYVEMVRVIKDSHAALVARFGGTPQPWAENGDTQ
jgi:hypothetical protein